MLYDINDNPIANNWDAKYAAQPLEIRNKLDALDEMKAKDYQLRLIKRKRMEINEGDVFVLSPREGIYFYGKVMKTNIISVDNDSFIEGMNVAFFFKNKTVRVSIDDYSPDYNNLLIMPAIVDKSYWSQGLFYNVGNAPITAEEQNLDYGFCDIGWNGLRYCNVKGEIMKREPKILSIYGISTITGIAAKIERELIMNPDILKFKNDRL